MLIMELAKIDKGYIDLGLSNIQSNDPLSQMSRNNRESLKEMIKYLTGLNKKELVDNKQLSELISIACANFIENEVEIRIEKAMNRKFLYFLEKI